MAKTICIDCGATLDNPSIRVCSECYSPADRCARSLPFHIGPHRITGVLGRGGYAVVFRGKDPHGNPIALKRARLDGSGEQRRLRDFQLRWEIRVATFLSSGSRFITVLGHDASSPIASYAMEIVEAPTLAELLETEGSLEPHQAASINIELLKAIAYLSRLGVTHNDLKPDNIFVARHPDGTFSIKVGDPGIWTFAMTQGAPEPSLLETIEAGLHGEGLKGTLAYMSPEQMNSEPLTTASDLFALAIITWEMLTGELPFTTEGRTLMEAFINRARALKTTPARPPKMPEPLYKVLIKALAYEPSKRYSTPMAFYDDLKRAVYTLKGPWRRMSTLLEQADVNELQYTDTIEDGGPFGSTMWGLSTGRIAALSATAVAFAFLVVTFGLGAAFVVYSNNPTGKAEATQNLAIGGGMLNTPTIEADSETADKENNSDEGHGAACDRGDAEACNQLGAELIEQDNLDLAQTAFDRACALNNGEGCTFAGALHLYHERPGRSLRRGISLLERACHQMSNELGCRELANAYRSGTGVKVNIKKADEFDARADVIASLAVHRN